MERSAFLVYGTESSLFEPRAALYTTDLPVRREFCSTSSYPKHILG